MEREINVQKLRFPEFKGEWKSIKLGDLFQNRRQKGNENLPIFSVTQDRGLISRDSLDRKMQNDAKPEDNLYVESNDLVYNMMRMWQGAIGISNQSCMVSPAYIVLKPNENVCSKFFIQLFQKNRSLYLFTSYSYGLTSDRLRLYYKDFSDIKFHIPNYSEQQKVSNFMTAVDDKLNQLKKKKSLLEQYKKGVMQKLFSQELRFKDEKGDDFADWVEIELGKLCKIKTGKLDANAMVVNGQYRFYTCAKNYSQIDKYAFDTEALLISGNGANVGYIHYYNGKFNAYQRTYVLDGFKDDMIYIKFFLQQHLSNRINAEKKEGNTPYIVLSALSEMQIYIPSLPEQTKVAIFLSAIEDKINHCSVQIEKMEVWKKGLLQKMFC